MENSVASDRRRLRRAILLALALDAGLWCMGYLTLSRLTASAVGLGPPVLVLTLEDSPGSPRGSKPPAPAPEPATATRTEPVAAAQTEPVAAAQTEPPDMPPVSAKPPTLAVPPVSAPSGPPTGTPSTLASALIELPASALSGPPTGTPSTATAVTEPAESSDSSASIKSAVEGDAADASPDPVSKALAPPLAASIGSALSDPPGLSGTARLPVQRDTSQEASRETLYRILNRLIQERLTYPPLAKQRNIQGVVGLTLVVSPEGKLLSLKLGQSSHSSILDRAAKTLVETLFPLSDPPALEANQTMLIQVRYILTL